VAFWLAGELELDLTLVHVVADQESRNLIHPEQRVEGLNVDPAVFAQDTYELALVDRPSLRVELGDPATELVRVASELDAEFLVLGSRGRGVLRAGLLGSVSTKSALRSPVPVFVLPPRGRTPNSHLNCVVCGVDDSDASALAAGQAGALAARTGARLVLAHISQDSILAASGLTGGRYEMVRDAGRKAARGIFEHAASAASCAASVELAFDVGDPAMQLAAIAEREQAQLLVVGSRGHGALHSALLGSVSRRLAAVATCPVMLVPAASRSDHSAGARSAARLVKSRGHQPHAPDRVPGDGRELPTKRQALMWWIGAGVLLLAAFLPRWL
jgi:nucleotide-binding universal stress UspA family protein